VPYSSPKVVSASIDGRSRPPTIPPMRQAVANRADVLPAIDRK
jgi:hypothetical protein